VTKADLNADGKLDLVVANRGSNDVSVLLGNGDGTFQPAVNYASTDFGPISVAVGDFNLDGKLDLAVSNLWSGGEGKGPCTVTFLMGNGDGTFQSASSNKHVVLGPTATSVITTDFNGDGKLDRAAADLGGFPGDILVLINSTPRRIVCVLIFFSKSLSGLRAEPDIPLGRLPSAPPRTTRCPVPGGVRGVWNRTFLRGVPATPYGTKVRFPPRTKFVLPVPHLFIHRSGSFHGSTSHVSAVVSALEAVQARRVRTGAK
jgi:hypothetical protein